MQNPIFGLMSTFNQGNNNNNMAQSNQFNPYTQNPNMMMNNMNNPLNNSFQNLANNQMANTYAILNNPMMNQMNNPMTNPMANPIMNPIMNPMMNPMNNNMPMAQMSQHIQNQYQNQFSNNTGNQTQNQEMQTPMGSNNNITLVFRTSQDVNELPLKIQCTKSEKISDVIERYRTKAVDHDTTKKFIFNARELDSNATVDEAGLYDGSNIFVVTTKDIHGA